MYQLKKNGQVFTSKFVETGPSSYEKRIYRAAVSQRLRNNGIDNNIEIRHRVLVKAQGKVKLELQLRTLGNIPISNVVWKQLVFSATKLYRVLV